VQGPTGPTGATGTFTATTCAYLTGPFVTGTNQNGGFNQTTVTCVAPRPFAVGVIPTWQVWPFAASCHPLGRRLNNSTVVTEWFSTPAGSGVGCQGAQIATMTLCCP
jgi:hypothetical protein